MVMKHVKSIVTIPFDVHFHKMKKGQCFTNTKNKTHRLNNNKQRFIIIKSMINTNLVFTHSNSKDDNIPSLLIEWRWMSSVKSSMRRRSLVKPWRWSLIESRRWRAMVKSGWWRTLIESEIGRAHV